MYVFVKAYSKTGEEDLFFLFELNTVLPTGEFNNLEDFLKVVKEVCNIELTKDMTYRELSNYFNYLTAVKVESIMQYLKNGFEIWIKDYK